MLVIVDAQNCNLHPEGEKYFSGSEQLIPKLAQKIKDCNAAGESILYTQDIPIKEKGKSEDRWDLAIVDELLPLLKPENKVKKNYYGIPPERLLVIRQQLFPDHFGEKRIEVAGVETNICVVANVILLQSAFPEADFYVSRQLVSAKDQAKEEQALALLADLNVQVVAD